MPGPGYSFVGHDERAGLMAALGRWEEMRHSYDKPQTVPLGQMFAREAAELFGADHCVPVNSGTSALLTALAAANVGPGDEVIVPGYTFIASIGSIVYSGATPVLAEIDESLTLAPRSVEALITDRTKAIMAVHMLGAPCDMGALKAIADRHGLILIEDVAQACGASYRARRLGTIGDLGAFSMNPFKVITCGEGGFVLTASPTLYQRAYSFHDQGWFPLEGMRTADQGDGDLLFGLNFRMPDLTAAVARVQLTKLDTVLAKTRQVKWHLLDLIADQPGATRRRLHDAEGECGTLLIHLFDDPRDASAVGALLGTKTLLDSGKHYYGNMSQLPALARGEQVCPFQPAQRLETKRYEAGALPDTDALLGRSVAISVGVSDSYLGAGFGVSVHSSDKEISIVTERWNDAVAKVLGAGV